jgi:hypothetical protein
MFGRGRKMINPPGIELDISRIGAGMSFGNKTYF